MKKKRKEEKEEEIKILETQLREREKKMDTPAKRDPRKSWRVEIVLI